MTGQGKARTVTRAWKAGVLVSVLVLGACSSEQQQSAPTGPSGAAESQTTGATGSSGIPSGQVGQWDPNQWDPTVRISLRKVSETERAQWREDYLAQNARDLDGPPPTVQLERWVHPHSEHDEVLTRCMTESGFPVEVDAGGIDYPAGSPPAEQQSAWSLAWYVCNARFTPDPDYMQDWTEAQIGLVYDYWEQYFIPCMAAHGYPISTATMPSRETYIATFFTLERTWWPNETLLGLQRSERERLEPVCSPYPPSETFFGS